MSKFFLQRNSTFWPIPVQATKNHNQVQGQLGEEWNSQGLSISVNNVPVDAAMDLICLSRTFSVFWGLFRKFA